MSNWKSSLVLGRESILNVIHSIDHNSMQIALIVDESDYLLGTVTDGDIRRAILRGKSLESPITDIMNKTPTIANPSQDKREVLAIMRKRQINHIPIVTSNGRVVGLETIHSIVSPELRNNRVVLMAGD